MRLVTVSNSSGRSATIRSIGFRSDRKPADGVRSVAIDRSAFPPSCPPETFPMRTVQFRFVAFLAATSFFCSHSPALVAMSRPSRRHRPPRPTRPSRRPAIRCTARPSTTGRGTPPTSCPAWARSHFPATTKKPEAQAFIDQGVAQLHSFYYFESERSFRQAAKIDPDCAMAYWGMAMSNVNNAKRAKEFLKEARKRAASASRREQLYIAGPGGVLQGRRHRQEPAAEPAPGARDDRPGLPRRHRRPRLDGDGRLAESPAT